VPGNKSRNREGNAEGEVLKFTKGKAYLRSAARSWRGPRDIDLRENRMGLFFGGGRDAGWDTGGGPHEEVEGKGPEVERAKITLIKRNR